MRGRRRASSSRFRAGISGERLDLVPARSLRPLARDRVPDRARCPARLARRARDGRVRRPHASTSAARPRRSPCQVRKALADDPRHQPAQGRPRPVAAARVEAIPTVESATLRPRVPAHAAGRRRARAPVAIVRQGADSYLVADERQGDAGRPIATTVPKLARIWVNRDVKLVVGDLTDGRSANRRRSRRAARRLALPGRVSSVTATADALTLRAPVGPRDPPRRRARRPPQARRRGPGDPAARRRHRLSRRRRARAAGRR